MHEYEYAHFAATDAFGLLQVNRAHGSTGTIRAKFRKNLPPSSLVSPPGERNAKRCAFQA